jgi:hypothetical protein
LRTTLNSASTETSVEAAAGPVDLALSREAAAQLSRLLSEFDPGAVDFIEAKGAALRPLFAGESWARLGTLIQGYSFAEAQVLVEQALKELPPA